MNGSEEVNNNVMKLDGVTEGETSDFIPSAYTTERQWSFESYEDEADVINSFMLTSQDEVSLCVFLGF